MRSSSLARVVIASFGVAVVITLGCGGSPGGPTPPPTTRFSVQSISPTEGPIVAATVARIAGTGFQSGDTVTVDGIRVDATVLSETTISLELPAHAAGKVTVTVINPTSQAQASVPGGFLYIAPPVISAVVPNSGSTAGGEPVHVAGRMWWIATVTVDGIVTPFEDGFHPDHGILIESMPAHAAGTVDVILTDRFGQAGKGVFTYASPTTFDFNGDWEAPWVQNSAIVLTIRDNTVISVSCGASILTLAPSPVVANGEFSFAGSGGVSITGRILSADFASGSINMAPCGRGDWWARKK